MTHSKYQTPEMPIVCTLLGFSVCSNQCLDRLVGVESQVEQFVPEIMVETESSEVEAHQIAWRAFIEAIRGDDDTPMWEISFYSLVSEYNMANYMIHLSVGSDVEDGFTVEEGVQRYIDWLEEERDNGVYGEYKVTSSFMIVSVKST